MNENENKFKNFSFFALVFHDELKLFSNKKLKIQKKIQKNDRNFYLKTKERLIIFLNI